ncbi:MAG: AAA family ATPase [Dehalococcoidales bacterium]|jgi:DNA polymerase-3 subunit delta'|nr:AAA family ATPase [Dehalococcoidales bacterium]
MWQTIGQKKSIELLQKALTADTLAHAYLLVGPAQVGKMTLALDLAAVLNCLAKKEERPCWECLPCQKIKNARHPDVQIISLQQPSETDELRTKTEIGIDLIGDIIHTANLPPFEGKYRVYIFEEAANLSLEAANRLLKTMEDPRAQVVFILITENINLIPATIASRCQRINLYRVKCDEIEKALIERWQIEPEKARLLARLSNGCPGWAVNGALNPEILEQRRERFVKMLEIIRDSYHGRLTAASKLAQQFSKQRETIYETLGEWIGWWRDALLVKADCLAGIVNIDFSADLVKMAGDFTLSQIKKSIQLIMETEEQLKLNVNARLALESLMLNLPLTTPKKIPASQVEVKNA